MEIGTFLGDKRLWVGAGGHAGVVKSSAILYIFLKVEPVNCYEV